MLMQAVFSLAVLFIVVAVALPCRAAEEERAEEKPLVLLKNDRAVVGLLPHAGGRVVLYRLIGGTNVLLADPKKWAEPPEKAPAPSAKAGYVFYNGHTYWVGPQSEFWTQQDVNEDRRKAKAVWPPDPYLELARCTIAKQTPTEIRLELPASPVCGLKLTKEVRLHDDGSVTLRATATNARQTPVAWDLWSNTRLPGDFACYVPLKPKPAENAGPAKQPADPIAELMAKWDFRLEGKLPFTIEDGFFHFLHRTEPSPTACCKAYLTPAAGVVAAFGKSVCFAKVAQIAPKEKVHPAQGPVEVYQNVNRAPYAFLLELEFHGEYRTLQPGDSMNIEETWKLLPYDGPDEPAAHVRFLREKCAAELGKR